ncbi:MAG: DUF4392 domain-containing protein [bacterium]|jgi:hypothetical protein|nr:DUF4392 domain-containing protein [bacterium]
MDDAALDRLVNLDLAGRGVAPLHEAARALLGGSPIGAAVDVLDVVPRGATVMLTTGIAPRPWVSTAMIENDGPAGTAVLARTLALGGGAVPVVVGEPEILPTLAALLQAAGLVRVDGPLSGADDVAAVVLRPYPVAGGEGVAEALLDELRPAALVSVERLGRNGRGVFHDAAGRDVGQGKAPIDELFEEGGRRQLPTIGVGDGGNEIGMGAIAGAVRASVPFGAACRCGCGGGVAARTATDVLVTAGVSNWACYAVAASLAARRRRPDLLHTPEDEDRLLRFGVELGLLDALRGTIDADVDAIPLASHVAMVELIGEAARRGVPGE